MAWSRGYVGQMSPTFCQDGARELFKTDEKVSEVIVVSLQGNGGSIPK